MKESSRWISTQTNLILAKGGRGEKGERDRKGNKDQSARRKWPIARKDVECQEGQGQVDIQQQKMKYNLAQNYFLETKDNQTQQNYDTKDRILRNFIAINIKIKYNVHNSIHSSSQYHHKT